MNSKSYSQAKELLQCSLIVLQTKQSNGNYKPFTLQKLYSSLRSQQDHQKNQGLYNIYLMIECPVCSCQFIVGYRHIYLLLTLCLQCFNVIRELKMHKNYVRFSAIIHKISKQVCLANQKLNNEISKQMGSLKQLLKQKPIEKRFQIKEFSEHSGKLSISTNWDTDVTKDDLPDTKTVSITVSVPQKYSEVVHEMMIKIQPTKQIFLKKAEGLIQSAVTVKQKCMVIKSQFRSLAAEIPSFKNIKKGLNGFLKFF